MRIFSLFVCFLVITLAGCKAFRQKKKAPEVTVQEAAWYNWIGGQPGVGGTHYTIKVSANSPENLVIDSLVIDKKRIGIEKISIEENLLIIQATENRSAPRNENPKLSPLRPFLRTETPENARLFYSYKNKKHSIELLHFLQEQTVNYQ
ncbi:MAG: hypothetical protein OEY56_09155 [Cyclobacteriaceae bacterium]|nr:hypothetical protein [Cyclobacteriaceae bacterium]